MTFWKSLIRGAGDSHLTLTHKLRLETLDGRIVPDATPVAPPTDPTPGQSPTTQQPVVYDVVVVPLGDSNGSLTSVSVILTRVDSSYGITYYDAADDQIYTGTGSVDATLDISATLELDAWISQNIVESADYASALETTQPGQPPQARRIGRVTPVFPSDGVAGGTISGPIVAIGGPNRPFWPYPGSPLFPGDEIPPAGGVPPRPIPPIGPIPTMPGLPPYRPLPGVGESPFPPTPTTPPLYGPGSPFAPRPPYAP